MNSSPFSILIPFFDLPFFDRFYRGGRANAAAIGG
jgi:hypothetical protein